MKEWVVLSQGQSSVAIWIRVGESMAEMRGEQRERQGCKSERVGSVCSWSPGREERQVKWGEIRD